MVWLDLRENLRHGNDFLSYSLLVGVDDLLVAVAVAEVLVDLGIVIVVGASLTLEVGLPGKPGDVLPVLVLGGHHIRHKEVTCSFISLLLGVLGKGLCDGEGLVSISDAFDHGVSEGVDCFLECEVICDQAEEIVVHRVLGGNNCISRQGAEFCECITTKFIDLTLENVRDSCQRLVVLVAVAVGV